MSAVNFYELAILYYANLEADFKTASAKIEKMITDQGGKIVKTDNWGKKELAYKIKQETQAIYVFYDLEIDSQDLIKLESKFNIDDSILRYQFYKPDLKNLDQALKHPEARDVLFAAETELEEDEEEKMEVKSVS